MTTLPIALCVVIVAALLGHRAAAAYGNRAIVIKEILRDVEALRAEIAYTARPMPQAIREQSGRASPQSAPLWQVLYERMQRHDGSGLRESMEAALDVAGGLPMWRGMQKEDMVLLAQLADALSAGEIGALTGALDAWIVQWRAYGEEAEQNRKNKGAMVQKLYVISGIALGIFCL